MKHNLDNLALQRKYSAKKKNAAERGINFDITFKEYCHIFNTNNGYCDYSGMLMSFDHNFRTGEVPSNYATLDRVDGAIGYTLSNLVLCRKDSNTVKAAGIEHNSKFSSSLSPEDRVLLEKICQTLFNPTKLAGLKQKYLLPKEETVVTITPTNTKPQDSTMTKPIPLDTQLKPSETPVDKEKPVTEVIALGNPELSLAEGYASFGREVESFGAEYNLTFANYKTLMSKVFCQLSKKRFGQDGNVATIYVVDKLKPIDKFNCLVVEKNLCNSLDIFTASGKLNVDELKTVAKNLSKLLSK